MYEKRLATQQSTEYIEISGENSEERRRTLSSPAAILNQETGDIIHDENLKIRKIEDVARMPIPERYKGMSPNIDIKDAPWT